GNVTVIVDETADLAGAADKICASKTFDNATSCSSENAVVVVAAIYDAFVSEMARTGGALISDETKVTDTLWIDGHLNPQAVARDADEMITALGLTQEVPAGTQYLAVESEGIGPDHPLSGEKLSRVLTVYRARDFEHAIDITRRIQLHQGRGHSVGIHTKEATRPMVLAKAIPTSRVIVNQAHTFATGGAFTNGMPFSLSMGCGSWGGNSIDTNVHWKHFMQTTKIVREIPGEEPDPAQIFGDYWADVGK
ncbi:MAG: sulfoacetaldehyde dehydrogenase, partial [Pseudomonadota bacterium]